MAINKNFVVKNGIEVNTSLIVADTTLNKVGVGTTVPGYTLHVGGSRGGIGATDITITGIATVGTSGSTSAALSVVGVSSFQGDVNFLGSAGVSTITFDASLDKLNFADNARATFGASDDLQIFHDGSNSIIRETGTGNIVLEGSGETLAVFADDGAVSLYYDDANVFQTTPQGVNVTGVTTSLRLNVSGISTLDGGVRVGTAASIYTNGNVAFAGLATANGGVQVGTAASIYTNGNIAAAGIVTANGGLVVGSAVTLAVNGNAAFSGIVTVGGDLKVTGDIEISEDLVLDTNLNLLGIASISNLDNTGAGIGSLSVSGVSTFSGDLIVGVSTFFVDVSTGRIGIGTNVPSAALQVGATEGTGIGVSIHENGNAGFTGIVTVGDKVSVGSGVTAFANGNLAVAGISTFNGNVLVGTGITIQPHGGVSIAGITTIGGNLNVTGNSYFVGMVTFAGGTNGNITLGDSAGDNVVFNADVNSNVIPNTDNAYDLGSSSQQWKDIYVNGVGYIDTVSADGVGIATATIRDSAKLDVDGDARFSGKVAVKDGGNAGAGVTIFDNGNIAASGIITASTFVGSFSGTVTNATNVTVADESSDTTCFPLFATAATGDLAPKSGSNLTFNSDTGALTATSFVGNVVGNVDGNVSGNVSGGTVAGSTGTFTGDVDIADKIVHTGDTDTAIRFPAADNFTIETGGTERARVNSGGVLLGITAGVGEGGTPADFNSTEIGRGFINLSRDDTAAADHILFGKNGSIAASVGTDTTNTLVFKTGTTERLRITNTGLIGVNTTPGTLLELKGESGKEAEITFNRQGVQGTNDGVIGQLFFENATDSVAQISVKRESAADDAYIQFATQATGGGMTERLRITSGGDVKVSTAATIFANGNATFSGISTFGGTSHIRVPVGTTGQRPSGVAGDFRYNTTTGGFEGYTDSWGAIAGGGGASESDTSVSSTSATSIYTTAHATNRSVSAIIQITQGTSYQVGRYLVIHDGTTATIIEESAVATGDMLGTFTADINGSNLRILVNMASASSATVTILPTVVTV